MRGISPVAEAASPNRGRLLLEFLAFFLLAPVVVAVFLPPRWMFGVLGALTLLGIVLLAITPGFRWGKLASGFGRMSGPVIFWVALLAGLAGTAIMLDQAPRYFLLIRRNPELALMIAALYPFLSALPQELVFRPLFFERYGPILPRAAWITVPLNAAVFSLAHLMYWSVIVASLTFLGGLVFAFSYRVRQNFPEAVVTHSLAGVILFALGMGVFFYSGNVTRPF